MGETEFLRKPSIIAFGRSPPSNSPSHADDWRELMRLYLVRRTRSFIKAKLRDRPTRSTGASYSGPSPTEEKILLSCARSAQRVKVEGSRGNTPSLFSDDVVGTPSMALNLPRYGLGNYVCRRTHNAATARREQSILGRPFSRGEEIDGVLSDESFQAPGEQRPCFFAFRSSGMFFGTTFSSTRSRTGPASPDRNDRRRAFRCASRTTSDPDADHRRHAFERG